MEIRTRPCGVTACIANSVYLDQARHFIMNLITVARKSLSCMLTRRWVYTTFAVWSSLGILNLFNSVREQWRPCLNTAFFWRAVSQVKIYRKIKAMIRLRRCVFCPAPLLFGGNKVRFSRDVYSHENWSFPLSTNGSGNQNSLKQSISQWRHWSNVQRVTVRPNGRGMIVVAFFFMRWCVKW